MNEEDLKRSAMYLAKAVRNEIEDIHVEFIPDSAMKKFNTAVRNGIFKALLFADIAEWRSFHQPPPYWEEPFVSEEDRALANRMRDYE